MERLEIDDLREMGEFYRWYNKKSKLYSQGFAWKDQAIEAEKHGLLEWVGVLSSQLATIKMTTGNEKLFTRVIDEGIVKNWVGIGWVEEGKADLGDYKKYPCVLRVEGAS